MLIAFKRLIALSDFLNIPLHRHFVISQKCPVNNPNAYTDIKKKRTNRNQIKELQILQLFKFPTESNQSDRIVCLKRRVPDRCYLATTFHLLESRRFPTGFSFCASTIRTNTPCFCTGRSMRFHRIDMGLFLCATFPIYFPAIHRNAIVAPGG